MLDVIYRLRSTEALFKWHELERCEIYLAPFNELNDPMENYKDVLWQGDPVLWENLLRHYVLALLWLTAGCLLMEDASFEPPPIPSALTQDELPTDAFRELYNDACDAFFTREGPSSVCKCLAALRIPLRSEGLRLMLSLVHSDAFFTIRNLLVQRGLMKSELDSSLPTSHAIDRVLAPYSDPSSVPEVDLETIAIAANHTRESVALQMAFRSVKLGRADQKLGFLLFNFPDHYVRSIADGLIHFGWHTACFMQTCTNASSWATYAKDHTGIALAFRPQLEDDGTPFIPLTGVNGSGQVAGQQPYVTRGPIRGHLQPVTYTDRPPVVDFFQSLGTLPRPKLERAWYRNRAGTRSPVIDKALADDAGWRAAYWAAFNRVTTTKLEDWRHEEEYRIVVADLLGLRTEKANRIVTYDFANLIGVVFGLRTSERDKIEIINIVSAECERVGRKDFRFFQIRYHASKGTLVAL